MDPLRVAAVALWAGAAGCSWNDPWGEADAAPARPFHVHPGGAAPAPRTPPSPDLRGRRLTLAECVKLGLENNPQTRASWQAARSAAARVGEERAPFLPSAAFSAEAFRSDTPELRDDGTSPQSDLAAGFGVRYLLFDGGLRSARLTGAAAELRAANFRHNASLLDVAVNVELAYAERLAADALARVAEEAVKRSQTHVELAKARHQAGMAPRFDVLKAETEKADADLLLVRSRGAARVAQGRLCLAMGVRVSQAFDVEEPAEERSAASLQDLDRLMEEAAKGRPEIAAARAAMDAREADVRAARAEHFPVVTAGADFGWRDRDYDAAREEWSVGIGFTLPLFRGFGTRYREGRARSELARASAEHDALVNVVELDVWSEYSRVKEAGEAVEAARAFVASAEEAARAAEGMYRGGAASIIELVDSLTARTEARSRQIRAVLDLHAAFSRFDRALGRTLGGDR